MKQRKLLPGIFAALGMLLLILDSKTALTGALEGIDLCLRTVVPSLFPFFVLSGILVSSLMGTTLPLLRPLGRLLGMPDGTESLLISGFLGGYPVGAKCIRDAWAEGHISKTDAEHLLVFCNNAGPAFLFGMAAPMFSDPLSGWVLWGIHILSALTAGIIMRKEPEVSGRIGPGSGTSLADALKNALWVTAQVCGWVVLFRVVNGFLSRWFLWLLPQWVQIGLTGLLELANGCLNLSAISAGEIRFLLCSAMLSFGGVCVCMQTISVTKGLNLRMYFMGKLLQTAFSLLFSLGYIRKLPLLWLLPLPIVMLRKKKAKRSGNPKPAVV